MKIAVIGSGYVGLVAAACFAELGHTVLCVDNDEAKIAALQTGRALIHEVYLPELLRKHAGKTLRFSTSVAEAVRASQIVFIAVGTPPAASGEADLSYVESVARDIASSLDGYKVIVEKSTVPVYTNEWVQKVVRLNAGPEADFDVVSNPEFLREGSAVQDFLFPDRIVIGADRERSAEVMRVLYHPLTSGSYASRLDAIPCPEGRSVPARLMVTSAKSAELIKHASNAFLAMKISFINAVANICEAVGADITEVSDGIGLDSRIGRSFLSAGIGYGGSCFPKDISAFRSVARDNGYNFGLLDEVHRINDEQRKRFLKKIRTALWNVRGKRIAALGIAFKGGTDDIRESPAIEVIEMLLSEGARIVAFDPAAIARARDYFGPRIEFAEDELSAMRGADAAVFLTDWKQFAEIDPRHIKAALRYPIVIDGRNLFSPQCMMAAGLTYHGVGRAFGTPRVHAATE